MDKKSRKKSNFDFHEDVSQQILYKLGYKNIRKICSFIYNKYEKSQAKKFDALIKSPLNLLNDLKKLILIQL